MAAHESWSKWCEKALEVTGETPANVVTHAVAVAVPSWAGACEGGLGGGGPGTASTALPVRAFFLVGDRP